MFEQFQAPHLLSGRPPKTPILVAFSGGSDSVALLSALREYAEQYGTPLRLAHVNHGIRGAEAVRDRDFCVAVAERYGLPISVLDADVPARREAVGGSLEEVAREVRYEFFARVMEEYDIPLLATAHHANDQLETILLRLTRGTGTDGLCGIPPVRAMGAGKLVIRPLLKCDKPSLEAFCRENGLDFVVDSTNDDISYARNRIRQCVIPQLQEINPAVCEAAVRLSETLCADVSLLTEQTDRFVREAVSLIPQADGTVRVSVPCSSLSTLPLSLRRRVLVRMMRYAGCPQAEERFVRALEALSHGELSLTGGVSARCDGERLVLARLTEDATSPLPPVMLDLTRLPLTVPFGDFQVTFSRDLCENATDETKKWPFGENVYKMSMNTALKFDTIQGNALLRTRAAGDRLQLRGHHHKVKKLFCDLGVPREMRERLPLLCDDAGLVLIPGIGVRDGASPRTGEQALCISVTYLPYSENVSVPRADRNTRNQQKEETDEE